MIDLSQTLGQLAVDHPSSTRVFLRHRLDFCCGGRRTLSEACREAGLDPSHIAEEITRADAGEEATRWDARPLPELIDFIVARYHVPLCEELPALIEAARKVERVHHAKASCPVGLTAHLSRMEAELHQHMAKEEQVLFPAIRAGHRGRPIRMPIEVMLREHDGHGESLRRLRELAAGFEAPPEACATWRALYAALAALEGELMEHIHLENHVLFPRALGA